MKTSPIDIVMTTWGRELMTKLVLKQIKKLSTDYRMIVVDNGSEFIMKSVLLESLDQGLINNLVLLDHNIGLEPAKNIGMGHVRSDLFISTDNDCLPQSGWLEGLVELMDTHPEYGAIACRPQVMVGTGNIFSGHEDEDIVEFPWPGGSLRIMRTELVRELGGWREDSVMRGSEERYISNLIHEKGFKTGYAVKIKTYHMFGDSNWGYPQDMKPEDHGHHPVWHPAIANGDGDKVREWIDAQSKNI